MLEPTASHLNIAWGKFSQSLCHNQDEIDGCEEKGLGQHKTVIVDPFPGTPGQMEMPVSLPCLITHVSSLFSAKFRVLGGLFVCFCFVLKKGVKRTKWSRAKGQVAWWHRPINRAT